MLIISSTLCRVTRLKKKKKKRASEQRAYPPRRIKLLHFTCTSPRAQISGAASSFVCCSLWATASRPNRILLLIPAVRLPVWPRSLPLVPAGSWVTTPCSLAEAWYYFIYSCMILDIVRNSCCGHCCRGGQKPTTPPQPSPICYWATSPWQVWQKK